MKDSWLGGRSIAKKPRIECQHSCDLLDRTSLFTRIPLQVEKVQPGSVMHFGAFNLRAADDIQTYALCNQGHGKAEGIGSVEAAGEHGNIYVDRRARRIVAECTCTFLDLKCAHGHNDSL